MNHYIYFRVATNQWITNDDYEGSSNDIFSNGPITITLNRILHFMTPQLMSGFCLLMDQFKTTLVVIHL